MTLNQTIANQMNVNREQSRGCQATTEKMMQQQEDVLGRFVPHNNNCSQSLTRALEMYTPRPQQGAQTQDETQ